MKLSLNIARRIAYSKEKSFSSFIIKIAIIAVTISVTTLILSSCIIKGFQKAIHTKLYNTWGHIHITAFQSDASSLIGTKTIARDDSLLQALQHYKEIKSVNTFSTQTCIAKNKTFTEGVLLKGFERNIHADNMLSYITGGRFIQFTDTSYSTEIVISSYLQKKLNVQLQDKLYLYFLVNNNAVPKIRKVQIVGIYETGMEENDKVVIWVDNKLLCSVNDVENTTIQGYELFINDISQLDKVNNTLIDTYINDSLYTYTIQERFPKIFSWLDLMKKNEQVILIITLLVAIINMITTILILILERTRMIGVLKSVGMRNNSIQKIFVIACMYIILIGLFFGNLIGLGLAMLQKYCGIIKLDQSIYYIKEAPIYIDIASILWINIITFVSCIVILIIPSILIRKINIVKAISYN